MCIRDSCKIVYSDYINNMSLIKKLFGALTEKPWEQNQAVIDSGHSGKTFEISNQMSAVIIIFGVSTTLFS